MKRYLLLLTVLLAACQLNAEVPVYSPDNSLVSPESQELIVVNEQIWYLTADGKILVYDSQGRGLIIPAVQKITAKHIANDGNDVVAQVGKQLWRWASADATWQKIGSLKTPVFALAATSQKRIFAITSKGVWDIDKRTFQLPASSPNHQIQQPRKLSIPAASFMDAQDNLWIGYSYGEWGGNIFTYDTRNNKFVGLEFNELEIELNPVKSFFQLKSDVGASFGLQHMMNSGTVARFQNSSAQIIYDSRNTKLGAPDSTRYKRINKLPYIGPAAYDLDSECIYFYSHKGVFRGIASSDLSDLQNWQLVFTPKLHWRNGQPNAVGSPMNVLKMLSLGNSKLVLLTQNDGVGIWDGNVFTLLK